MSGAVTVQGRSVDALTDPEFRRWLIGYARLLGVADAEDAAQEALAAVVAGKGEVNNPRGYAVQAVKNRARRRRFRGLARFEGLAPSAHHDSYADPDLARALAGLPRMQRACLALRYGQDLTLEESAGLLGVAPSTVAWHVRRGLETLRNRLGDGDG